MVHDVDGFMKPFHAHEISVEYMRIYNLHRIISDVCALLEHRRLPGAVIHDNNVSGEL